MIVLVVGAGAVGSFLGVLLGSRGHDVTLVRRRGTPGVGSIDLRELDAGNRSVAVRIVTSVGDALSPELIVLAVKIPDLPGAIGAAAAWPDATVIAVENGIGADELLLERRPGGGLVAGSLTASVELDGDSVRRLSRGGMGLAPVRGDVAATISDLAEAFAEAGLRSTVLADAASMRWSKLLANLVANATSAILDMDPAAIYADRRLFAVEMLQLREAAAVMRGLGLHAIRLPGADARLLVTATRLPPALVRPVMVRAVAGGRGGKSPSLRLHLESGRPAPTEVAWLNGAVVRAARGLGRRAPTNERLALLVDECASDPARRAWFRGRPDRLLDALRGDPPAG